jgi:hypothetical protein
MLNAVLTRWELIQGNKFEIFLRELREYLKSKLILKRRPNITPFWSCNSIDFEHYNQSNHLKEFCKKYDYDWEEVKLMIDEYYLGKCNCDCHILQAIEWAGIQPNRRPINGIWRYETFPDECYEILSGKL